MTEEIPEYPGRESARERKMMARFRCENEERVNRYWVEEEERRCRMCYEERKETIEHMWERKERGEILNEDGREIRWMKKIWKNRGKDRKIWTSWSQIIYILVKTICFFFLFLENQLG
jgi:hypothetical protein